jgi:5-methylcytosine-specific restriction endonuclease McrA
MPTIADYFSGRRKGQGINRHIADAFGIPFPVKKGWLAIHGPREITEYMAQKLLSRPEKKPKTEKPGPSTAPKKRQVKHGDVTIKTSSGTRHIRLKIDPKTNAFLSSFEWRSVRMEALKLYGAKCMCCEATPSTGAVMNVDHIRPRKLYPSLALDINNLQILCDQCNHGKGNWDQTDWRAR